MFRDSRSSGRLSSPRPPRLWNGAWIPPVGPHEAPHHQRRQRRHQQPHRHAGGQQGQQVPERHHEAQREQREPRPRSQGRDPRDDGHYGKLDRIGNLVAGRLVRMSWVCRVGSPPSCAASAPESLSLEWRASVESRPSLRWESQEPLVLAFDSSEEEPQEKEPEEKGRRKRKRKREDEVREEEPRQLGKDEEDKEDEDEEEEEVTVSRDDLDVGKFTMNPPMFKDFGFLFTGMSRPSDAAGEQARKAWLEAENAVKLVKECGGRVFEQLDSAFWEVVADEATARLGAKVRTKRSNNASPVANLRHRGADRNKRFLIVIADKPRKTIKFLVSLARKVPVLSLRWVFESIKAGRPLIASGYELPAGFPLVVDRCAQVPVPMDIERVQSPDFWIPIKHCDRVFASTTFIVHGTTIFSKEWSRVLIEAGARKIIDKFAEDVIKLKHDAKANDEKFLALIDTNKLPNERIRRFFREIGIPMITTKFIADCLILQEFVSICAHESYFLS